MTSSSTVARPTRVSTVLIVTLALQCAVPPFATDTYTPAFPQVTHDLQASAGLVGLTLTLFFLGFGAGQLVGGPLSDQYGRRRPLLVGAVICALGAIGCALAPSIGFLVAMRFVQGLGGGIAATIARAVVIDVARGDQLARVMSIMMALGGLAPAIAPVTGGLVLTFGGTWRVIFWILSGFGAVMIVTAALFVPETLPREDRQRGGLTAVVHGFRSVLSAPRFVGFMLTAAFSAFSMLAYIANASYALQEINGMPPLPFSLFFASTALAQVALSVVNAKLIGRFRPERLIAIGLGLATAATALVAASVLLWNTALLPLSAGFLVLMASQAFIFGNAGALAAAEVTDHAGSASGVQGITQSLAMAVAAPLASAGGAATAVPMVIVMVIGVVAALAALGYARTRHPRMRPTPAPGR
ncbi:MAG: multidrug effflux MFS transporter [Actinobacteria bacterium]|nr:multidrug effflux MFS transporter [Actinomycetota bacterium]